MTWRVRYTRTFLKEMAALPGQVRHRVESIVLGDEIKREPYLAGKVRKMIGYQDFYKIRIGDYRIGLRIDAEEQAIELQRVLHRREIYRKFP